MKTQVQTLVVHLLIGAFCISSGAGWAQNANSSQEKLRLGIKKCNPAQVNKAIQEGANVNVQDEAGLTPLMLLLKKPDYDVPFCSEKQGLEIATLLLQARADVNKRNLKDLGYTALMYLATRGRAQKIWGLSKKRDSRSRKVRVIDYFPAGGWSKDYPYGASMAQLLLNWGAKPELLNKESYDALMLAANSGNREVAYTVKRSPTDLNRALFFTVVFTDSVAVKNLLAWGASVHAKVMTEKEVENYVEKNPNIAELFPLDLMPSGSRYDLFSSVVEANYSNVDYGEEEYDEEDGEVEEIGPVFKRGEVVQKMPSLQIETAKALMDKGASFRPAAPLTFDGMQVSSYALCLALSNSKAEYVQWLLKQPGINPKESLYSDFTGIIQGFAWNCVHPSRADSEASAKFKLLQGAGVDINMRTDKGYTPLMIAAKTGYPEDEWHHSGHYDQIPLLIEFGADTTLRDKNGKTAYDWYESTAGKWGWKPEYGNLLKIDGSRSFKNAQRGVQKGNQMKSGAQRANNNSRSVQRGNTRAGGARR